MTRQELCASCRFRFCIIAAVSTLLFLALLLNHGYRTQIHGQLRLQRLAHHPINAVSDKVQVTLVPTRIAITKLITTTSPKRKSITTQTTETTSILKAVEDESPPSNQSIEKRIPHIELMYSPEYKLTSVTCGESLYTCTMSDTTESAVTLYADVRVFFGIKLPNSIPKKLANQLWVINSGESQTRAAKNISKWNGYFDYSTTFKRDSDWPYHYSYKIRRLDTKTSRNFAKERKLTVSHIPTALWFVSNCRNDNEYRVTSGRVPYAVELSKWIHLSIYTSMPSCKSQIDRLAPKMSFLKPRNQQPPFSDFHFYLAFENSLCTDYITEKLWKILKGSDLVIPIVMGGLEMEEYERIAPPNSYIHVKNFTSPKHLAEHLKYVVEHEEAFNYYLQWRNEYELYREGTWPWNVCKWCVWAHEKPQKVWNHIDYHFNQSQCLNMADKHNYCKYYGMDCKYN